MKTDADRLAEAREYIEEHGWTVGTLVNKHGEVCSMGGIVMSQGWYIEPMGNIDQAHLHDVNRLSMLVLRAARANDPECPAYTSITDWNDSRAKDPQEVLDAFAKAEKTALAGFDPDA